MSSRTAFLVALIVVLGVLSGCTDEQREAELVAKEQLLSEREAFLEERGKTLSSWADELDAQQIQIDEEKEALLAREKRVAEQEREIQTQQALLAERKKAFEGKQKELLRGTAPSLVAKHAIAVDVDTGMVLYEKDAHTKAAVASTQKLLTALLVVEAGDLDAMITVEESDTLVEPTKMYVKAKEIYRRGDVLEALLVRSCNDLAMFLGRDNAGTLEAFIEKMNTRADQLGMVNSHFLNPHGLTLEGQYSTASDMAKLAIAAYKHPEIRKFVSTKTVNFTLNDGTEKTLTNTNRVMQANEYCNGMKTGYTRASGFCLVASGEKDGLNRIVVILGSTSTSVWKDAQALLEWALQA